MRSILTQRALVCASMLTVAACGTRAFAIETAHAGPQAFLDQYCVRCHGGEKVKGKVDFTAVPASTSGAGHYDFWKLAADVVASEEMPPEDEKQPSAEERASFQQWYEASYVRVEASPGVFRPRRLSTLEYRNTMRSLFGFDLENKVVKAEQTVSESSLILKLMPTDAPGGSGFINDTHAAPISVTLWDQYAYFADVAVNQLFERGHRPELEAMLGEPLSKGFQAEKLTPAQAASLLKRFMLRAFRRPVEDEGMAQVAARLKGLAGAKLVEALKFEMKAVLLSPGFLYRGMKMPRASGERGAVDGYELAERLSYFLWEDMPDDELATAAADGGLADPVVMRAQIGRMLRSPKAESLSKSFALQWLTLNEIDEVYKDPVIAYAFKSQPLDFLNYLFTESRPVMELIDSEITFANHVTAEIYPKDRAQMKAYVIPKGTEKAVLPNQKIRLENTEGRGGLLTMPGVLAMNHGPVIRGAWMLQRVLGEHIGEPPADVPPIKASMGGKKLSFREQFARHRDDATCARCHDKIDPLGFAFEGYNAQGAYLLGPKDVKIPNILRAPGAGAALPADKPDASGKLPTGETFADFEGLKQVLMTSRREDVVRNIVKQTLAYAICRKLEAGDTPTVEAITEKIVSKDGTWLDLFAEVANSLPFREADFSKLEPTKSS